MTTLQTFEFTTLSAPAPTLIETTSFQDALKWHQQGQLQRAEAGYLAILDEDPDHPEAGYLLGLLAKQTGRAAMAIRLIEPYLRAHPNDAKAMSILALAHFDQQDYAACAALLEQALKLNPQAANTHYNLGQAYQAMDEQALALQAYEAAVGLNPNYVQALSGAAMAARALKDYSKAVTRLEAAIVLEPMNAELHFQYGNLMSDLGYIDDALHAYGAAHAINNKHLPTLVNLAGLCRDLDQIDEALQLYDCALDIDPAHPEANYNKALALLSDMRFAEGWTLFERRLDSKETRKKFVGPATSLGVRTWQPGQRSESLLVIAEQGLGDQIFFASMLDELAADAPGATVCVDSRLVPLLQRSFTSLRFIDATQINPHDYDAQIQLGSLGLHYRASAEALANVRSPFLAADKERSAELRRRMRGDRGNGRLVCGLSWISKNADHGADKSLTLEDLLPVLGMQHIDFIDLQYGDTRAERAQCRERHGIDIGKLDDINCSDDIDGLAALIDACDLVLTVSNTTAHLAAALGKPTIVMLPDTPAQFWYWHRHVLTTPWYPSARLFRKSDTGSWDQVIDAVALTLAASA